MNIKEYFSNTKKEKYAAAFLLAFLLSGLAFALFVIPSGGYFTYYGDFNAQQIPFYYHVHEAVREGRLMWDFTTELGSDMFSSYTFYLLGSPFFWLTVPFPNSVVPYLIPWLLCLKTAVASVTAYGFTRRFSENTNACLLGGLLYAFSGFQIYNIFYNHFHDAVAFFPLLLICSDKYMQDGKKGRFAAAVALCAITNYFFFAGMAVFTVIYFAINIITGHYRFTAKSFAGYAFEAVIGVLISAVILVPAANTLMGTSRASDVISVSDAFVYSEPITYLYILKSFFTFPDLAMYSSFPASNDLAGSSCAAWLPFVSMCGVFCYIKSRPKKDTLTVTLICSFIFMLVPVLNSAFTMLNSQYYARWYFCPILIMCVMTASAAAEDTAGFKRYIPVCGAAAVIYFAAALIYKLKKGSGIGAVTVGEMARNYDISSLVIQGLIPIGCLVLMYSMLSDKSLQDNGQRLNGLLVRTGIVCWLSTTVIIAMGKMTVNKIDTADFIKTALCSREAVEEDIKSDDEFFRVDHSEDYLNYNLMWDLGSCSGFNSTVSAGISDYMRGLGYTRMTSTNYPMTYSALRSLLSVKYYFDSPLYDESGGYREPFEILGNSVESFDYKCMTGDMLVYENNCYIPMGFAYDKYVTAEDLEKLDSAYMRSQTLLEAVVLDSDQAQRFPWLERYDISQCNYDYERLKEISEEKTAASCEYFQTDNGGFSARYVSDKDSLVFFSVPYDKGWSAQINGEDVPIERVSYGFMAVLCPAGTSEIRFDYVSKPLVTGAAVSAGGIIIFIVYIVINNMNKRRNVS